MRTCEISHFFCYDTYREKAVAMKELTGEKELLITPEGWTEDYHGSSVEPQQSDQYMLVRRRPYLNWRIWGGRRFQIFFLSPCIVRDMQAYRPDVIDVDSEPFGLLALEVALIRRLFFPKTIFVVHTSQNINKRYPFPFGAAESFVLQQATVVFARSKQSKVVLLAKGCKRPIYIVPHGVDVQRFSPVSTPDDHPRDRGASLKVGYVGSLARHKGVHILLDAVSRMDADVRLTFVGDGPERPALEARAAGMPNVDFPGSMPNMLLPRLLRQLDVLVLPSLTLPNWKEQFGRVMIEAMACGVPVVGSATGCIPEVIGDGGIVFEEGNVVELAQVLTSLARDRDMLRDLSGKARRRVLDHYSWRCIAERVQGIWSGLVLEDTG